MEQMVFSSVVASIIVLGIAFLASLLCTDGVSGRIRLLMCGISLSLITVLIIALATMKNGETSKDSSFPVKTATADLPVGANEGNEASSFVVEPNDSTEAGSFVTEAYQRSDRPVAPDIIKVANWDDIPAKTATTGSSIEANEEDKPGPNDTTEAGPFVSEKSYRSLRRELDLELRGNPWTLARYLQAHDVLDEFGPSVGRSAEVAVNAAASLFLADDSIRERAYEKAVKLFSDAIADADWEEFKKAIPRSADFDTYEEYQAYLRSPAAPTRLQPLARIAETGETISTEPAGPWEGPFD